MKKIKSILQVYVLFLTVLLFIDVNISYSQSDKSFNSGFKISLSEGITFNLDENIHDDGKTFDPKVSNFTVELTNFEIGYFLSNHSEIGLSIGKNSFTNPDDYKRTYIGLYSDTIFSIEPGYKYGSKTWFALYYNYHFQNYFKAGIKLGGLSPAIPEDDYLMYLSLSVGKFFKVTDNFLIDFTFSFTNRNNDFEYFKSNQLNLTMGFNLKI